MNVSYYDEEGAFVYPQLLGLSMDSLTNEGIYLMDDGRDLYMLIGSNVNSNTLHNLFGINSLDDAKNIIEDMMYYNSKDSLVTRIHYLIE